MGEGRIRLNVIALGSSGTGKTHVALALDRLTHHVHILTINGDSYRLKQSAGRRRAAATVGTAEQNQATAKTGAQPGSV